MPKIKYAVVGCGSIGRRHCAVIDAEERAVLAAVCDINQTAAKTQAGLYKVDKAYSSLEQLLQDTDIDVVDICTPHHLHAEMSIATAKAGKHILVEKPMALTSSNAEAMIAATKSAGVSLTVMKQNRFNVPIRLVTDALKTNRFGKIFMVQCNVLWNRHQDYYSESDWRGRLATEGGALYTQVSHFIDLLVWWFGVPTDVNGTIGTKNHAIEIEDCGSATITFDNDISTTLLWTTCVYNKNFEGSITLVGEKGIVKIGGKYLNKIEYWDVEAYPLPDNINMVDLPNLYGKYQGTSSNHDKVVKNHVAMLLGEKHELVDGPEGKKSIEMIEHIYTKIRG